VSASTEGKEILAYAPHQIDRGIGRLARGANEEQQISAEKCVSWKSVDTIYYKLEKDAE